MPCRLDFIDSQCCPKIELKDKTLEELIDHYISIYKPRLVVELEVLNEIPDFICGLPQESNALSEEFYRFHNHQWCFKTHNQVVKNFYDSLKEIDENGYNIENFNFNNYEDLYEEVRKRKVKNIGDVAIYDFALRFVWKKDKTKEPKKFVYIHAHPKDSASRLNQIGKFFDPNKATTKELNSKFSTVNRVEYDKLQPWLKKDGMTSKDIENFLCIYRQPIEDIYHKEKAKSSKKD